MTMLKPAFAALAALLLAPSAAADERASNVDFAFEIQVSADDVASADSAMQFLNRLERRVRVECGGGNLRRSLAVSVWQAREDMKACVDSTMRAAVDSLRSPTIAQAYDMRRG